MRSQGEIVRSLDRLLNGIGVSAIGCRCDSLLGSGLTDADQYMP